MTPVQSWYDLHMEKMQTVTKSILLVQVWNLGLILYFS